MIGLLIELRRGPGLWAAIAAAIAGAIYVTSRVETLTLWSASTAAVAGTPYLLGPIVAGMAAWVGARPARRNTALVQRLGARSQVVTAATEIAAVALWTLAGYAALIGVVFTITMVRSTWGSPSWLWVATAAIGLVVYCAVGWALGRLLPLRFTPFGVAVGVFVMNVWSDFGLNAWWERLLPSGVTLWLPFDEVRLAPLWGQILWCVGLVGGVLLGVAIAAKEKWSIIASCAAVSVVCAAVGVGVIAAGPTFFNYGHYIMWTCTGESPQVCVHPAYESSATELRERAERIANRLAGTPFQVTRVEQRPRAAGPAPESGTAIFAFDEPVPRHFERAAFEMATSAFSVGNACFSDETTPPSQGLRPMAVLVNWAAGLRLDPVEPGRVVAWAWITARSDAEVRQWINDHADKIRTCTLSYEDFR